MLRAAAPVTGLVAAALLVLGACRSEEPAPDPGPGAASGADPDAAEIRTGLAGLFAGDHPNDVATSDGRCFAVELTDRVTPDELHEAGVVDASYAVVAELPTLPEDVAREWVEAQFACTDFVEASTRAQVKVTKGDIDTDAYAACLRDALTEDQVREATVASLTGEWDDPAVAELSAAQVSCADSA